MLTYYLQMVNSIALYTHMYWLLVKLSLYQAIYQVFIVDMDV